MYVGIQKIPIIILLYLLYYNIRPAGKFMISLGGSTCILRGYAMKIMFL